MNHSVASLHDLLEITMCIDMCNSSPLLAGDKQIFATGRSESSGTPE